MFETLPFSVRQTFRVLTPGFCHPEPGSGSRRFSLRSFSVLFLFFLLSYPLYSFFSTSLFFCSSLRSLPFFFLCPRFSFSLLPCSLFSFSPSPSFFFLPFSYPLHSLSFPLFTPSSFSLPCSPYFLLSFFFSLRSLSSLSPLARGMTDWECGAYRRDDGWRERE